MGRTRGVVVPVRGWGVFLNMIKRERVWIECESINAINPQHGIGVSRIGAG